MKTLPITIVVCGLFAAYATFPTTFHTPAKPTRTPRVMPQDKPATRPLGVYVPDSSGSLVPLRLQRLNASVTITGTLAVTTMDITVYNPHARVLEGEFETPVMEGQTVCRFALDINGKLREGVVVEKEKARVAFESVIKQKIDPALLEWTRGNTFKTRIYPLPARGTRRIVVAFEQELAASSEGYAYTLPFAFKDAIDTFDFTIDVAAFGQRPSLAGNNLEGVAFTSKGRSYAAEIHRTAVVVDKPFRCAIPVVAGNTFTSVNTFGNERYFAAFIPVPNTTSERPAPKTITLLWDVSLSARMRDINKELDLLDAYFKKIGNTRVSLVPFSIEAQARRDYTIAGGDWSALRSAILAMPSDGATQLGSLPLSSITSDLTLLVSDGVSTFGQHVPPRASRPLCAITSSAQSDHDVLRALAEASGGSFVNLIERTPDDALALLTTQRPTLMRIDVVSGAVSSTYPVGAINAGMLTVGGIMQSEDARLELKFGSDGRVVETMSLAISARDHADTGTAVARLWAQSQLRQLNMNRMRNEAAIVSLGKKFTIVTPGTSLIVLDRIQDYVQHRIEPPASEPGLRTQYLAMVQNEISDSAAQRTQRLNDVANLVAGRKSWYERTVSRKEFTTMKGNGRGTAVVIDALTIDVAEENAQAADGAAMNAVPSQPATRKLFSRSAPMGVASSYRLSTTLNEPNVNNEPAPEMDDSRDESRYSIASTLMPPSRQSYFDTLAKAPSSQLYARYLALRERMAETPGFYIDASDIMRDKGLKAEALRVLSNMAEIATEDPRLLRVLGQRLMQLGESEYAVMVFDDVKRMRGEEPQSYRDLGLACAQAKQYQRAVDNLYTVVTRTWDARFPEIELIAVNELNRVLHDAGAAVSKQSLDPRLLSPMQVDMRVVMTWDADDCDMDLWVIDPRGEKCFYSNRDTELGGHLSRDLTGGYGPEEFLLKKAPKGKYEFKVHYYGDRQQRVTGPTTVTVDVFTNYGTAKETKKSMIVRLDGVSRVVDVGSIAIN